MSNKNPLFCKDCIHAKISLIDRIFTLNGLLGYSDLSFRCKKFTWNDRGFSSRDLVTGPKKEKPKLMFCESARSMPEYCGKYGKYWHPKKNTGENLIKFMQKDNHNE